MILGAVIDQMKKILISSVFLWTIGGTTHLRANPPFYPSHQTHPYMNPHPIIWEESQMFLRYPYVRRFDRDTSNTKDIELERKKGMCLLKRMRLRSVAKSETVFAHAWTRDTSLSNGIGLDPPRIPCPEQTKSGPNSLFDV